MDIGTQRQVHGFPQSHPAGPDELACLVIVLCLSGRDDGVSLHLRQERFGERRDRLRVRVLHGAQGLLAAGHLPQLRSAENGVQLLDEQRGFRLVSGAKSSAHAAAGLAGREVKASRVPEDDGP
ncbi:hypothetical protein QA802_27025 [Streptomyces sp. B21-105]|uniref:hypothetical protein n=1 Tax=Streptomyces sp. B21-105 TaxID=3039417 RepID=UPI002FF18B9A